jgi:trehalose 6-phosphate phosphatase
MASPPDLIEHRDALAEVLRERPAGLFLDIDGTLAPLHPDPTAVTITPALKDAIAKLAARFDVVMISGRATDDSRRIIGSDRVTYVGNHGSQFLHDGVESVLPAALAFLPRVQEIVVAALARFKAFEGIYVEDKGPSMSIHYRTVADRAAAERAIDGFLDEQPAAKGLWLTKGKMVREVRPPLAITKGTALTAVVEERGLRAAVMLGDDTTDVDGFRAVSQLREAGAIHGLSVGVLSDGTPAELLATVDYTLAGTDAVERLLTWLAAQG